MNFLSSVAWQSGQVISLILLVSIASSVPHAVRADATAPATPGAMSGAPRAGSPLSPGSWVSVKGKLVEGRLVARKVEKLAAQDRSVKGTLDSFDAPTGVAVIGSLRFAIDAETTLTDEQDDSLARSDFKSGQVVKISLEPDDAGQLRVTRIRLRKGTTSSVTVEGPVESVSPGEGGQQFRVLGIDIVSDGAPGKTGSQAKPSAQPVDDEEARPDKHLIEGKAGYLSGELRLDANAEEDYDLDDDVADDFARTRLRAQLEWILPSTEHVSAMFEVKADIEEILEDDADDRDDISDVQLGESWVFLRNVLGDHGSVQIGRSKWDDKRDFWYRADLDSFRFFFEWPRFSLETSLAQQIVDPEPFLKDARYSLLKATFLPSGSHRMAVIFLDRDDWRQVPSSVPGTSKPRGFAPRYYGVEAFGEIGERWSYWVEAALARGSVDGEPLRGHAADVGVMHVFSAPWEPTLVASYAFGTGDRDPLDDETNEFRQSGLEGNSAKWNGLTDFRSYGEVLRPELSNIHVVTLGFGVKPRDDFSIDLVWHSYRQDEPTDELDHADVGEDRDLDAKNDELGTEWDLILAYEGLEHWEFELDLGVFLPGPAFVGRTDAAMAVFLKVKYLF